MECFTTIALPFALQLNDSNICAQITIARKQLKQD